MPPPARVLWQVPEARAFSWLDLGDVAAVYNPASGEIHLLDALAQEILDMLAERPQPVHDVARGLGRRLGQAVTAELEQRVAEAITEFDRLGLVFPLEVAA